MKTSPKKVKYKGEYYDINTSALNVIQIYEWLISGELDDIDQGIMIVTKVFGEHAPVEQPLIDLASKLIIIKDEKEIKENMKNNKRDMCFVQDYSIYRADIIREYGIDISEEEIDFETLVMLLENLSSKSRFNEIRELRNKNLGDIKDHKTRKMYREAQEYYKLKDISVPEEVKQEEKELDNKVKDLAKKFI